MITQNQLRKIFALLKSIGQSNDWLHEYLPEWTGKFSLKLLSVDEANKVIEALNNIQGLRVTAGKLTAKQESMIRFLSGKLHHTSDHLKNFIHYTIKEYKNISDLTINEASLVITGMKKILIGNNKPCKKRRK